jgi:signal transduction histidine kinase
VWVRHLVILAILGTLVAVTELYVIEQLAHEVNVHRRWRISSWNSGCALERAGTRARARARRARARRSTRSIRRGGSRRSRACRAGIAHDFNNALTVIIGTADVAKLSLHSPDDVASYLDEIVQAAKRAGQLTTQLLTLGRAQIGAREPVEMTDFAWDGCRARCAACCPTTSGSGVRLPADPVTARVGSRRARAGRLQPRAQRARRDAGGGGRSR